MSAGPAAGWQVRLLKPRHGLLAQALRAAELGGALGEVMLARANVVEDAQFQKIVPNEFVIELPPDDFELSYAPIQGEVTAQWREQLLNLLTTTNSRQGRREYRFGGQVGVAVRAAADLAPGFARILSRLRIDAPVVEAQSGPLPACLELLPDGRRWPLRAGVLTLGRDPGSDLVFDMPQVQDLRLVSSQHAYLRCAAGVYRLFDGAPDGTPSVNGTYINRQKVPRDGQLLQDGDIVILAALNPAAPLLNTPGVVGLRFRAVCE
ncbi:MAG TPA: FhaA domain-containing protein [Chloroflexia bacterium]|nr:FhaA domain-containing protein [Chloroflexia bacterium]